MNTKNEKGDTLWAGADRASLRGLVKRVKVGAVDEMVRGKRPILPT